MNSEFESALAKVWGKKKGDTNQAQQLLGTAFFISPTLLITCKHVVELLADEKYSFLYIKTIYGHGPHQVDDYKFHPKLDIALLRMGRNFDDKTTSIHLSQQDRSSVPEVGESCNVFGFRVDTQQCLSKQCSIEPYSEIFEKITFSPKIPKGFSGGPLLNKSGECIGINIAKSDDTECSFAIPVFYLRDWLSELSIRLDSPNLKPWQRSYLKSLMSELKLLRLDSMLQGIIHRNESDQINNNDIQLSNVYSPLSVNNCLKYNFIDNKYQSDVVNIAGIKALACSKYLVMRGDPGCGKSTFTRYWAYRLAFYIFHHKDIKSSIEKIPEELLGCFPIHIELDKLYRKIPQDVKENEDFSAKIINDAIDLLLMQDSVEAVRVSDIKEFSEGGNTVLWFFDGLDEIYINDSLRKLFLEAFNKWVDNLGEYHRICLTSRPYAYSKQGNMRNFETVDFVELTPEYCFSFINKLYSTINNLSNKPSIYQASDLISILRQPEWKHLLTLCLNPMLASLTCVLYYKDGPSSLPKDRAGLYKKCVNSLLGRWEDKYGESDYDKVTFFGGVTVERAEILDALSELAFYAHLNLTHSTSDDKSSGDVTEELLERHFISRLPLEEMISKKDIKSYLHDHTGILVDRNNGQFAFSHRTFREFLTAKFILSNDSLHIFREIIFSFENDPGWWREVIVLVVLQFDGLGKSKISTELLLQCLPVACSEEKLIGGQVSVDSILVVANSECERSFVENDFSLLRNTLRKRIIDWLLEIIGEDATAVSGCVEAGKYLGVLGDPRPGVGTIFIGKESKVELPDIKWAEIPSSNNSIEILDIDETFSIDYQFQMSVYPVTRKQFQAFLDHPNGYDNDDWWSGVASLDRAYHDYGQKHKDNYPRSFLSWYEASAFCKWLTSELDKIGKLPIKNGIIRLPYEWEWQHAATSCDPLRKTPWAMGTSEIHPTIANVDRAIGDIVSVGIYAGNKSDQGVYDLIGNTVEWCTNDYKTLDKSVGHYMSVKGGDFSSDKVKASLNYRGADNPSAKDIISSIRLVCVPH